MSKKTKFGLFLCVLVSASCIGNGAVSSSVTVWVNPWGEGEELRRGTPIVHLDPSVEICRPRAYSVKDLRENLEEGESLLSEEGLDKFLGEPEEQDLNPENLRERSQNIKISLSSGWTRIGLKIANQSRFHLVITSVSWRAAGRYKGETYEAQGALTAGYCSGSETLPFLYFVPPGRSIEYLPLAKDRPLENLSLYFTGFPAVDRSGDPSIRVAQALNQGTAQSPVQVLNPSEAIIAIPNYQGDLTLRGYFMNEDGIRVSSGFAKRQSFNTTSDFTVYQ